MRGLPSGKLYKIHFSLLFIIIIEKKFIYSYNNLSVYAFALITSRVLVFMENYIF